MSERIDVETLRPIINAASRYIASYYFGKPTGIHGHQWRFLKGGAISVEVDGPKMGLWIDHRGSPGDKRHGDMFGLIQRMHRCDFKQSLVIAARFANAIPMAARSRVRPAMTKRDDQEAIAKKKANAARYWREAVPLMGTPVEAYLRGRGITPPPRLDEAIRYHPNMPIKINEVAYYFPAMLAVIRDVGTDEIMGVHLTAITLDGERVKHDGATLRRIYGLKKNGVIKLTPLDAIEETLCVGEGIESVLSLMQLQGGLPGWSLIDANNLIGFPVLDFIHHLIIGEDDDKTGTGAARELASRWGGIGRKIDRLKPNAPGVAKPDFNDELMARGVKV